MGSQQSTAGGADVAPQPPPQRGPLSRLLPRQLVRSGERHAHRPERGTPPRRGRRVERLLSMVRFVLVGSGATALSSVIFLVAAIWLPAVAANTVAAVLSTAVGNHGHAVWTFRSARRGLRMQLEATLTALLSYAVTTLALLILSRTDPDASRVTELVVLVGSSAAAGVLRYLLLLLGVFPDSPVATAVTTPRRRRARLAGVRAPAHGSRTAWTGRRWSSCSPRRRSGSPAAGAPAPLGS
jgi:putative flippase GtrA